MSEFSKVVITAKGQALIAKLMSGSGKVEFTEIRVSETAYTESQLENLTALTNVKQTTAVSKVTRINEVAVRAEGVVSNESLTDGYYMRTIGLFAKDPQDDIILFAVTTAQQASFMPPFNGKTTSGAHFKIVTTIGNSSNVTIQVDPAAVATIGVVRDLEAQNIDLKSYVDHKDDELTTQLAQSTKEIRYTADLEITDYMFPSSTPTKAYVTFIDDDGSKAVSDKFLPIFSSKGVPCTLAVNVDNSNHSVPTMTKEEVKNLQDTYGWEIASHGYSHMNLVNASNAGESTLRREIVESYYSLKSYGLNVKHLVYPYGAIDDKGRVLAAKYFKSGTVAGGGLVNKPLKTFNIQRVPFGSYYATGEGTYDSYKSKVDEAIADKKWLIFMLHAWTPTHDATQQQHLSDIIDYCLANNVEIVNLDVGYKLFGNKEEVVGEYVVTNQGEKVPLRVTGEYKMISDNTVNIDTPQTYFKPYTETITQIHTNLGNTAGFPANNGLLRTIYPWAGGAAYVTQILTAYRGGMWYRTTGASSEWTDFYRIGLPKHAIVSTGTNIVVPANGYKAFNLSVPFAVTLGIPIIASPVGHLGGQFTHSVQRNTGSSVSITVINNASTEADLGILEWSIKRLE